jgi:20S proteasome subunit alpha 5
MYATRNEYDRGVNTFSPEGRLWQLEYAMQAIKLGSTVVGVQTAEGVVLGAEKRLTSRLMEKVADKIVEIDSHIGCGMSGLVPDARTLIDAARVDAQNYTFTYDEPIPIESVTQSICDLSIRFGEDRDRGEEVMSRPFGVALLIGGVDEKGPVLFHTDPAGNYTQYLAKAIGNGADSAQTMLEEKYYKSMTLEDAKIMTLTVLRQVMEEKLTSANVEISVVTTQNKKLTHLPTEDIEALIAQLPPPDVEGK